MAIDPARAQLVTQAYRYETRSDPAILAEFPNAREIVRDTALDQTTANTIANAVFTRTSTFPRTFSVEIEEIVFLEDFTGSPNRYVVDFGARHPAAGTGLTYTVIGADTDFNRGVTKLTVRA